MKTNKPPLLTRPLLLFMGTMILANIAGHIFQPLFPLYLQTLGASVGQVGLFFTLGAVAPLAFQILGGWLSDALGRLQAIAIGSMAGVASYAVLLLAPSWQWLLLASVLTALAVAFVAPSFQAFIAEQSTEETRGRVYGLTEGLFMVVGIVGPPIGGYLSEFFGFKAMFLVAAAFYTTAAIIRVFMARGARRQEVRKRTPPSIAGLGTSLKALAGLVVGGGIITWIMISDGARDITYNMTSQLQPLYLQNLIGLSYTQISWLSSISALTTMLLMAGAGWLSDKKGVRLGIASGFVVIAAGFSVFLGSRAFGGLVVAWVLFGVGYALMAPAYNALISKAVPNHLRGTAFGLFSTSIGIISLPAPYFAALLWTRFGPQTPFYAPILVTVFLVPIIWIKFKLPAPKPVTVIAPEVADAG
ncbi:MAG: MFS transporter [Anaerolineae bacterium]|nr:MFS transporter [Anaerolineae bacterium]